MLQEKKEQAAVDALYDEIFLDAFISQENNDFIDKSKYCRVVRNKLQDDHQLKSLLISQFDRIDKTGRGTVDEGQVKQGLRKTLVKKIQNLAANDGDSDNDGESLIGGYQGFTEGAYAKDTIHQILESFKGCSVDGDEETFIQMNDLLEIFYNDPDMNRELTKVRGNDFCEMLGLFFDLTDSIRTNFVKQLEDKEKLQADFDALKAK